MTTSVLRKEVISSENVANVFGGGSLATKAGPFLFMSGRVAADPKTGRAIYDHKDVGEPVKSLMQGRLAPDGREGPVIGQTWALCEQIGRLLEEQGASRQDVLLYLIAMRDAKDFPRVINTRAKFFAPEVPPPSTAIQLPGFGLRSATVSFDVIGFVPDGSGLTRETITRTGEFDHLALSHYKLGSRVGPLCFYGGVVAARPENGEIILGPSDLPAEQAQIIERNGIAIDSWEVPFAAQTIFNLEGIKGMLEEAGGSLDDIVRLVVYLRDIRNQPTLDRLLRHYFGEHPPAVTTYAVEQLAIEEFLIEIEPIALLANDGSWQRRAVMESEHITPIGNSAVAVRAGPLMFVAGQVASDQSGFGVVRGIDQAGELASQLATGSLAVDNAEGPVLAQTSAILERLAGLLHEQGTTLEQVLKLNVYLTDMRDYPVFERVVRSVFPSDPPAIAAFQVPTLPVAGATVQIELVVLV